MSSRDRDGGEPRNETAEALADLHMAGIAFEGPDAEGGLTLLEDLPGYGSYMAFLARHGGLLRKAGVRSLGATFTDRARLNGDGVFHIYPGDFDNPTRETLRAALGVSSEDDAEDMQRDLPVVGARGDTSAQRSTRIQNRMRSRLLGALRFLDPIIPAHAANAMARKLSVAASIQLEEETEAAQGQRDKIAAWYVAKTMLLGRQWIIKPTDALHTKFNLFIPSGEYTGYSLKISPLPPFQLTLLRSKQVGSQWQVTVVSETALPDLYKHYGP